MMRYRPLLFLLVFLLPNTLVAQVGGEYVYEFLNLPNSARITALGGSLITVRDNDQSLAYGNPALLNAAMHNNVSFNYNFHFAEINTGYATYARYFDQIDMTFHGGFQFINYGEFDSADPQGNLTGTFDASELAFVIGASRALDERFTLGANLKVVSSQLESYNSTGLMGDLAAIYFNEEKNFTAAFVMKNMGGQLTTYEPGVSEPTPFEIQFGLSQRLKYLPFRFSVIMHDLQRWNLLYDNPNSQEQGSLFGPEPEKSQFNMEVDNFFRHFIFSGEFLLGKAETVRLRFGYNHQLRKELTVNNLRSLAGFSAGFGFKVNRFQIDYGLGVYHIAGSTKHLSISTNIDSFRKNRILE